MEIQAPLRSKVQSVQLVSLINSKIWKKYGNKPCNQKLVDDLKILETEGVDIEVPVKKNVKAGLQFIVGDNLGQHCLAEMNSVFSSGRICRWCKVTYNEACRDSLIYAGCKDKFKPDEWTVEDYEKNADKAIEEGYGPETFGVKDHCVFNQLESYHSILGMPPCIGHDFYEGTFSRDIQFYLSFIINKEKLISPEEFNEKLKNVKLSSRDSGNRPREFKAKRTKYEGNAGSLRVLSRIVTMLLTDILDDSRVGSLIVKLHEVSDLVTAPRLTIHEIENILHFTIIEYLDLRALAIDELGMETMKPKHHYMAHYSKLYKFHGPLIHLWAMRMESKHQFFKNCIRTSKNFINPTKTCATRHQLAQVSFRYNGLFPKKLEIPPNAASVREIRAGMNDEYLERFLSIYGQDDLIPTSVKVFGTKYEPGMILILHKNCFGSLKVGLLNAIACSREETFFGCTVYEALQSKHGYYVTTVKLNSLKIINQKNLADHHPLKRSGTSERFCFSLHHYVSEGIVTDQDEVDIPGPGPGGEGVLLC